MAIERFEDIDAWKAARELTRQIYKATALGKVARDYGLPRGIHTRAIIPWGEPREIHEKGLISLGDRDRIQRAAVSIMANPRPIK